MTIIENIVATGAMQDSALFVGFVSSRNFRASNTAIELGEWSLLSVDALETVALFSLFAWASAFPQAGSIPSIGVTDTSTGTGRFALILKLTLSDLSSPYTSTQSGRQALRWHRRLGRDGQRWGPDELDRGYLCQCRSRL